MRTQKNDNVVKLGNKKLYNRIRQNIIRKKRMKALERKKLENGFISNAPINKLKNSINNYVSKCRIEYYSMLDI